MNDRRTGRRILRAGALTLAALALPASTPAGLAPARAQAQVKRDRTAVLLAINDVYRIEGLEGGALGGLARVRTLRRELEREAPDLLMLHGGDFLFPSFASRMYRGEQMVAVMNALDGDPNGFDARFFVTFGNHEFDRTRLRDAPQLKERIDGSQFRWLGSNFTFVKGKDGSPVVESKNLAPTAVIESGGIRIGLFGLTIQTTGIEYIADFQGEQATARALSAELRAQGAEVVVAVTHLTAGNDRKLLEALGDRGPDLVIGGHDHESMAFKVNGRWVLKADADARTATVVRLTLTKGGSTEVRWELRKLGGETPRPDPDVQRLVDDWQLRHATAFCTEAKGAPNCLDEVYGRTRVDLGGEESKIRGRETTLGDWVADQALDEFRACGARAAFLNSGSLRINTDLPAGSVITRRHVEELFAYPAPLFLLRLNGDLLARVAEQSVRGWPGSGTWLQIGGFAFRHDTTKRTASALAWLGPPGPRAVAPADPVLAVTPDYLINPDIGDQDGYVMLNRSQVVEGCAANGTDLKALVIKRLKTAEPLGIAPKVEGRICQGERDAPCLASSPVR